MTDYVVDENVPIVANDSSRAEPKAPQADPACRLACVRALKSVVNAGILIIDSDGIVLEKYRRHLQHKGQPGIGDAFFKHVVDHQFDQRKVRRIPIQINADREFEAFPVDVALATFDRSDRVYVTLALVAPDNPQILNAVDSDYVAHRAALERVGSLRPRALSQLRSADTRGTAMISWKPIVKLQ